MREVASIFIDILLPVFGVVAVGWGFGRRASPDPRPMARAAYYLLAPAFIFEVLSDAQLGSLVIVKMVVVLIAATAAGAVTAVVAARIMGHGYAVTAALVLVSVYGNVGNFGLPVVAFAFGEDALPLAGVAFLTVNVVAFMVGVTAATWRHTSFVRSIGRALATPAVAVVPLAVAVNLADLELPVPADRAIGLLAQAMIPVMLLTLGLQLAGMSRPRIGREVVVAAGIRLAVVPAAAALATVLVGLRGDPAGVVIVQSAMPAAVFTALIAIEHDLEPDLVTTIVLFSTVASALTLTAVLALAGAGGPA